MVDTAFGLLAQGLLTQLPASLVTVAATAFCTWIVRKRKKPEVKD